MAVDVMALTARDRYVLHSTLKFCSSTELKLGQNIHRNKVPEREEEKKKTEIVFN